MNSKVQDVFTESFPPAAGEMHSYQQIIHGLPAAIYTCNSTGHITLYNEAAVMLWGRKPELGEDMWCGSWKIYRTDGSAMPLEECPMAIVLKTGNTVHTEIIIERPDGTKHHVIPHPRPILDASGKITGAVNMLIDITTQKQSQKALEESEVRLRLATEGARLGTWDLDLRTGSVIYSPRLAEIFGHPPSTIFSHLDMRSQIHPGDIHTIVEKAFNTAMENGIYNYEARILKPDKTTSWIKTQGKVIFDGNHVPLRILGTVMDITEQKTQSEKLEQKVEERTKELVIKNQQLVEQKEFVDTIIDSSVDIVAVFDKALKYVTLNKPACELYQVKKEDVIGKSILELFPSTKNSGIYAELEKALKGRAAHNSQYKSALLNHYFENFYIPLLNSDNNVYGVLFIGHDITDVVEANQVMNEKNTALERSNRELESFSYVASHDLQEPLRKIQTFALLAEKNEDAETTKKYLSKITVSAKRMSDLINDVLNYSSLLKANEQLEITDLNSILENVKGDFELLIKEKEAVIKNNRLPAVKGVPLQLNQLFSNLISNSLKFSDRPPVINIGSAVVAGSDLPLRLNANGAINYLELIFSDNGIGFEQEYADLIFTIFQRLHGKQRFAGTGIGLALVKKIVENHHGFITVKSELGKGASFYIYLPATVLQ